MTVRLRNGEVVKVEKLDGYSVIGDFHSMDENFICVIGTVGDGIGRRILIPMKNVAQIEVIAKRVN